MITVTASNIWDLKAQLGIRFPAIAIRVTGPCDKPEFIVSTDGKDQSFYSPNVAALFLRGVLKKFIKKPPKGAKNARLTAPRKDSHAQNASARHSKRNHRSRRTRSD